MIEGHRPLEKCCSYKSISKKNILLLFIRIIKLSRKKEGELSKIRKVMCIRPTIFHKLSFSFCLKIYLSRTETHSRQINHTTDVVDPMTFSCTF
jgi:hypothetical protein